MRNIIIAFSEGVYFETCIWKRACGSVLTQFRALHVTCYSGRGELQGGGQKEDFLHSPRKNRPTGSPTNLSAGLRSIVPWDKYMDELKGDTPMV